MTLRTPRRRISPRAKRRYRAIKDFLRRALGSSSQPDIKINSSIAINVSDLKHKIVGIEQQLTQVNKHCRELVCLESSSRKESQTQVLVDRHDLPTLKEDTEISSTKNIHRDDTKLLYKTSESHYRKSDDSDSVGKACNYHETKRKNVRDTNEMPAQEYVKERKTKKKIRKFDNRLSPDGSYPNLRKHKARSTYENFGPSYEATTSYHSLNEPLTNRRRFADYPRQRYEEQSVKQHHYMEPAEEEVRVKKVSRRNSPERALEQHEGTHRRKSRRNKPKDLNDDFIADIIKRQYRPIRMFGKRESEISQFSAPVCRDQEYPIRENIIEGSELCSCCFDGRRCRHEYEYDLSDMRSICDTRLYSAKRHSRHGHRRRHAGNYNDSNQYDLVPVKEKSSPKTRRKFVAEAMIPYGYKEVPPSPRTHRPRLNLRAQYYDEFEDYMLQKHHRNELPKKFKRRMFDPSRNCENIESSDITTINNEKLKPQTIRKPINENLIQQDVATMSCLQSPLYINEHANVTQESVLNKTQETNSSTDKTDKALSEIKDILQSFLQEIKKETVSQCDNSEISAKVGDKCLNEFRQESAKLNTSGIPNSGHSVNKYSVPQCGLPTPFMQSFNPCCYPILPMCPMPNCMQNGYMMPSASYTCASCANNTKEDVYHKTTSMPNESSNNVKNSSETDQLIKEIYKFVAQSPLSHRRQEYGEKTKKESTKERTRRMTTRSVGGSSKMSRHDAQVETQKIKCHSKSCEAIGSRFLSESTYNSKTNPSYSDTILERLSLEAATGSDSEYSSESTTAKKGKTNKFSKVLRSFGLFKKKKDAIEEMSESESTVEVEVKAKKPPFRQELTNYMVHDQEYYHRPPVHSPHQSPHSLRTPYPQEYRHTYEGCHPGCPDHLNHVNPYHNSYPPKMDQHNPPYRSPRPSAPPYPNPYEGHSHSHSHNQPQVPLCLKEIEVKSIGTQSDRKMTLLRKFTKKMQPPTYPVSYRTADPRLDIQNGSTQTAKDKPPLFNWKAQLEKAKQQAGQSGKDKPGMWSWKTLQAKVNQLDDPVNMSYSYKTQKQLAQGDIKMRNAMLKKLFYKRNPFSPRNLIVRTILGKDKSSYGEPPLMYRPRMFF